MARKQHTNNQLLYQEIKKSLDNLKNGVPKSQALTPKAVELLFNQTKKTLKKMYYKNHEDYEDCVAFAMEDIIRYWDGFNPDLYSNAFAYYSTVIFKGACKGWNKLHPKGKETISLSMTDSGDGIYTV